MVPVIFWEEIGGQCFEDDEQVGCHYRDSYTQVVEANNNRPDAETNDYEDEVYEFVYAGYEQERRPRRD